MLNVKNFKVNATDEIIAPINLWGQSVDLVLCIELDEDEENEKQYIDKAMQLIEKNIDLINEKVENLEDQKDAIIEQLLEEDPLDMTQEYIENKLNDTSASMLILEDSTKVSLPLTENEFLNKLLICEYVHFEIIADEDEEIPEITITVGFGTKDNLTGGHGWDIDIEE